MYPAMSEYEIVEVGENFIVLGNSTEKIRINFADMKLGVGTAEFEYKASDAAQHFRGMNHPVGLLYPVEEFEGLRDIQILHDLWNYSDVPSLTCSNPIEFKARSVKRV